VKLLMLLTEPVSTVIKCGKGTRVGLYSKCQKVVGLPSIAFCGRYLASYESAVAVQPDREIAATAD
jgi:hypothetical protein